MVNAMFYTMSARIGTSLISEIKIGGLSVLILIFSSCIAQDDPSTAQSRAPSPAELHRISYTSLLDSTHRDYFLYLPAGYDDDDREWPVIMHLHGNGERGNGKNDLQWVTKHGPLMEAWVQKRDLPFIIIVPQLQMLGMDTVHRYIAQRDSTTIPRRLDEGVPPRLEESNVMPVPSSKATAADLPYDEKGRPLGWYMVEDDLLAMISEVKNDYRGDSDHIFLTGLSYGGYGSWYMASKHPDMFRAVAPIAGWGHPDLMESLASAQMPIWCFAGARDQVVPLKYFYPGIDKLKELGHSSVQFTVIEDMGHDVWKRVYRSEDIYNWFLSFE